MAIRVNKPDIDIYEKLKEYEEKIEELSKIPKIDQFYLTGAGTNSNTVALNQWQRYQKSWAHQSSFVNYDSNYGYFSFIKNGVYKLYINVGGNSTTYNISVWWLDQINIDNTFATGGESQQMVQFNQDDNFSCITFHVKDLQYNRIAFSSSNISTGTNSNTLITFEYLGDI